MDLQEREPIEYDKTQHQHSLFKGSEQRILLSKYPETIFDHSQSETSTVHLFPQLIDKKKEFLLELIDEVLPGIFPQVFPYNEQFSWLNSEDYLLPNQADLSARKVKLEDEYKNNISKINKEIEENHLKYKFLHDLIHETDDLLVKSVKLYLEWLGFLTVIDMDETKPEIKEEDIQIPLEHGLLIIEVKGIRGTSKNSDYSQINTIKFRRAEQRGKFDVYALYLVNHQRYLPPQKRKNPPFIEQQIKDARNEKRGLLTTYNLFKLYSNIEAGFVQKEDARTALLQYGLV